MSFDIINEYKETMTNLFWQSRRCQLATIPTRGYKGDRHKAVLMLASFDSQWFRSYHDNNSRYYDQTDQAEAVPQAEMFSTVRLSTFPVFWETK